MTHRDERSVEREPLGNVQELVVPMSGTLHTARPRPCDSIHRPAHRPDSHDPVNADKDSAYRLAQ